MAASLGVSRAGSVRAIRRVQTRERTPVAVPLLGGGHAVQLGQELLAVPVAVLGGQGQGG